MVRMSAISTPAAFLFLVLISFRGWVDPRVIVRPEGLCQRKIPMAPSRIEPATFRLVAQCLNRLSHCVTRKYKYNHVLQYGMYDRTKWTTLSKMEMCMAAGRNTVQCVPLKTGATAWRNQGRILFRLIFGRIMHSYRRCWKWDSLWISTFLGVLSKMLS